MPPCSDCKRYLKFGCLFQRAKALGCEGIATGHYTRYVLKKPWIKVKIKVMCCIC